MRSSSPCSNLFCAIFPMCKQPTDLLTGIRTYTLPGRVMNVIYKPYPVRRLPSISTTLSCDWSQYLNLGFSEILASPEEIEWLGRTCPYFTKAYLDHVSKFRFKPEQVQVKFIPLDADPERGRLEITATGPWHETILWEVPLMACLSELYFKTADTDWSYDNQRGMSISITLWNISVIALEVAYEKAKTLLEANIQFSEFGTRRRRSFYIQDLVVDTLIKA